jgi:hypothetical protein
VFFFFCFGICMCNVGDFLCLILPILGLNGDMV